MAMKRWMIVCALVPLLAACGSSGSAAPTAAPAADAPTAASAATTAPVADAPTAAEGTAPTAEGAAATADLEVDRSKLSKELHLFNWSEYLDPALKDEFQKEYGVTIIEDPYDSNEAMLAKVRAGNSGYDIVVPSDYAVQTLVTEKLLAPLDKSLLPNLSHMDPQWMNLFYDPGNVYSVPYFWTVTGLAYNKKDFPTPPDSWSILFDPASMEKYRNKFTMLDDARESPGTALIYAGKSVNTTDQADLAAAQSLLQKQKEFVQSYDSVNVNLKLATGEIELAQAWTGLAATAINGIGDKPGNPDIAFTVPKEGGVRSQDNMAILAESQNQYTAHVFVNFLMRPDIAARNADYVLYLTPNKDAEPLLDQATKDVFAAVQPDAATVAKLEWIERNEQTDTAFSDLWTQVTGQ